VLWRTVALPQPWQLKSHCRFSGASTVCLTTPNSTSGLHSPIAAAIRSPARTKSPSSLLRHAASRQLLKNPTQPRTELVLELATMFGQTANGPQRIFSPMGEFLAWDTLFLQKASAPSLKHLIEHPDYPLLTKPKRPPESFVILLEEGPPGMSTTSAGSKAALYEQAREEYKTQSKLHSQLQKWVKNSLNKDLFDACCPPGQNAFQWRRNIVELLKGELKEPIVVLLKEELKEPSDPTATEQGICHPLLLPHDIVSANPEV
jgi:hypothetical protein